MLQVVAELAPAHQVAPRVAGGEGADVLEGRGVELATGRTDQALGEVEVGRPVAA